MENLILSSLTDEQLISGFRDLVIDEQEKLVSRLEHIVEMDRRKLFLHQPSLWACLVEEYGMEEWVAERYIRAARLLSRFPELRSMLAQGSLNLSLLEYAVGAAHREKLSNPELWELLEAISGMSCRAARREIAIRFPHSTELARDRVRTLTEDLSELKCVVENSVLERLEEIRGFLAHAHPQLSMGELIGVLAAEYHERHHPEAKAKRAEARQVKRTEKRRRAILAPAESPTAPWVKKNKNFSQLPIEPRANTSEKKRHPSQTLTHQMILKMGYRCSYVDPMTGKHCQSTFRLDKDHIRAWADGGKTDLQNLRWLCNAHHRRVSFLRFGESAKYFKPK
jgi:hypothetical protein